MLTAVSPPALTATCLAALTALNPRFRDGGEADGVAMAQGRPAPTAGWWTPARMAPSLRGELRMHLKKAHAACLLGRACPVAHGGPGPGVATGPDPLVLTAAGETSEVSRPTKNSSPSFWSNKGMKCDNGSRPVCGDGAAPVCPDGQIVTTQKSISSQGDSSY